MPQLRLNLLGRDTIFFEGQAATRLARTKAGALLAHLAAESPNWVERSALCERFWPGRGADAARNNLRQVLFQLTRQLPASRTTAPWLESTPAAIRFHPEARCDRDIDRFQPAPACCETAPSMDACDTAINRMQAALSRYQGHFWDDDLTWPDSDAFHAWVQPLREHYWQSALALLERCVSCLLARRMAEAAIQQIAPFLQLEPLDDGLNRQMMLALAAGERAEGALRLYQRYEDALQRDTDATPQVATRLLYERIARETGQTRASADFLDLPPARRVVTLTTVTFETAATATDMEVRTWKLLSEAARVESILQAERGHIVKPRGGVMFGFFGYPGAREDAAERAVRAAYRVQQDAPSDLSVRISVTSDTIITGPDPDLPDPAGHLSERGTVLARETAPGDVNLTSDVAERLPPRFLLEPCAKEADGSRLFRLQEDRGLIDRTDMLTGDRASHIAGRANELDMLLKQWERALSRGTLTYMIRGEAGIGKSRLARALAERIRTAGHAVAILQCDRQTRNLMLAPVQNALAQSPFAPGLSGRLPAQGDDAQDPVQMRVHHMEALLALTGTIAAQRPLLLICDDAHWADSATREFLHLINRRLPDHRILIVLTARMGFRVDWPDVAVGELLLKPLSREESLRLIELVDTEPALPVEVREQITAQGEGIPLFIEELIRHAREFQWAEAPIENVPRGLHDLLAARLEQLGEAREIAQWAAALGRDFDARELQLLARDHVVPPDEALRTLMRKGFIEMASETEDHRYRFRHNLFQQIAFASLPDQARCAIHGQIADQLMASEQSANAERISTHLSLAGRAREAVPYRLQAGMEASSRAMFHEAIEYFREVHETLTAMDADDAESMEQRIDSLLGLGAAHLAIDGYGSPEVHAIYTEAFRRSNPETDPRRHFSILWGLWLCSSSAYGFDESHRVADEMLTIAAQTDITVMRLVAHYAKGGTCFWTGHFVLAREHLQSGAAMYQPEQHAELVRTFGENTGLTTQAVLAWTLWHLGESDEARAISQRACQAADRFDHAPTRAFVHCFDAALAFFANEPDPAEQAATATLEVANRYGYPLWQTAATAIQSWVQATRGDRAAVFRLEETVLAMERIMVGVTTIFLAFLLRASEYTHPPQDRQPIIERVLQSIERAGDRFYLAEALRLRGEASLQADSNNAESAQADLQRALKIATEQGASQWEHRARRTLASLGSDRR